MVVKSVISYTIRVFPYDANGKPLPLGSVFVDIEFFTVELWAGNAEGQPVHCIHTRFGQNLEQHINYMRKARYHKNVMFVEQAEIIDKSLIATTRRNIL